MSEHSEHDPRRLLALRLLARDQAARDQAAGPRRRHDPDAPAVLSFAQERMWFAHRSAPDPEHLSIPLAFQVTGPLDLGRLREAFAQVVARHEILRTRYRPTADGLRQVVLPDTGPDFAVVDLVSSDDAERTATIVESASHAYRLAHDAPLRVRVHRLGPDSHVLVLTVHHIACDAWALQLLFAEVRDHYLGTPAPPPLPVQYADYAEWERTTRDDETLRQLLANRVAALAGAPTLLNLHGTRPRPQRRTSRGAFHRAELPGAGTRVRALARAARVTPFTVLLACYRLVISAQADTADLMIGVPVIGRGRPELDRVIGCFLNLLVLRGDVRTATVAELVAHEHRAVLDAFAHDVPFERLVQQVRPARVGSAPLLVQTTFSYRPDEPTLSELGTASLTPYPLPGGVAQVDLALDLVSQPDGDIAAVWSYDDDLFPEAEVAALAARFADVVDQVTTDPGAAPADLVARRGLTRVGS